MIVEQIRPSPIQRLLPELVHIVFEFFLPDETHWGTGWSSKHGLGDESQHLLSVALVSKTWYPIAIKLVWRSVLVRSQISLLSVLATLSSPSSTAMSFPHGKFVKEAHLEVQRMNRFEITPEAIRTLTEACPILEELTIICRDNVRHTRIGLAELTPARCPRLKRLRLYDYILVPRVGDDSDKEETVRAFLAAANEWVELARDPPPCLSDVYFYNIKGVPASAFTVLLETLGSRLRFITLWHVDSISRAFWERQLPRLCPLVECVGVHYSNDCNHQQLFSPNDRTLRTLIMHYPALMSLAFSAGTVSDGGLRLVGTLHGLRFLSVRGNYKFSEETWAVVIAGCRKLNYVQAFGLNLAVIRLFWEKCTTLRDFNIHGLGVSTVNDPWFSQAGCTLRHGSEVILRRR